MIKEFKEIKEDISQYLNKHEHSKILLIEVQENILSRKKWMTICGLKREFNFSLDVDVDENSS